MATDFFQRQDTARRNTAVLVALFLAAVVGIVALTSVAAYFATREMKAAQSRRPSQTPGQRSELPEPWIVGAMAGLASLALISGGTLFKVLELRSGGGRNVAESVGGRQLYPNDEGLAERRLLNIVEEMAIASGTPVPPVYLMEDDAINAFAAGYSPGDAVIGVTRGACEQLSREELQGVIAHEFSHVLNGDMRTNIRLIGILHGILLLSLVGKMLLHSIRFGVVGRRDSRDGGKVMLLILAAGVTLYLLGSLGALVGGLIKAGVSRQREYLADASAVQFTRNPGGIGGALLRIGAKQYGSRLKHPNAAVASHMYFAQGVFEGLTGLMATHPPLPRRVRAILPNWDGSFPEPDPRAVRERDSSRLSPATASAAASPSATAAFAPAAAAGSVEMGGSAGTQGSTEKSVRETADDVGNPEELHRLYAAQLLAAIPRQIIDAAHEPASARAIVIALLLDFDPSVREKQLQEVSRHLEPPLIREAVRHWEQLLGEPPESRLPLLDLTLPALATMSTNQFNTFSQAIRQLIRADKRVSLFEWTLSQVLMRHLQPKFRPPRPVGTRYYSLHRLGREVSVLLSVAARVGHRGETVTAAFTAGCQHLPGIEAALLSAEECNLDALRKALERLATVASPRRRELVEACAAAICVDHQVTVEEAELLRGISDLLDCPVPPRVPATAIRAAS